MVFTYIHKKPTLIIQSHNIVQRLIIYVTYKSLNYDDENTKYMTLFIFIDFNVAKSFLWPYIKYLT